MSHEDRFPSSRFTRAGLLITTPLAIIFAMKAAAWATTLKTWNSGDTLTAADLNANFNALQGTAWTPATLATGWSHVDTATNFSAGYKKVGDQVYLRGYVHAADTASNPTILTLPAGFRPAKKAIYGLKDSATTGGMYNASIDPSGTVQVIGSGSLSFSLDGLVFSVD